MIVIDPDRALVDRARRAMSDRLVLASVADAGDAVTATVEHGTAHTQAPSTHKDGS